MSDSAAECGPELLVPGLNVLVGHDYADGAELIIRMPPSADVLFQP